MLIHQCNEAVAVNDWKMFSIRFQEKLF